MPKFVERLKDASRANRSLLCIGLDPDPSRMPIGDVVEFNKAIVDATRDLVCAYKPNLAFYEAMGSSGIAALEQTVAYVRSAAPQVVIIGDAKRGDIASTNVAYARALFKTWDFDAATVNCYAGGEALEPFLEYETKGIFVWCRSSNPGGAEFQDLGFQDTGSEKVTTLYERVAARAAEWNRRGNVGVVVGATYPAELERVRSLCRRMPILAPAVGAQGGDVWASVRAGADDTGRNLLVSSSRSVLYASDDPADFAQAARDVAQRIRDRINRALEEEGKAW